LAEFSYYIESNGEAAIIDPIRDIDTYLDLIKQRGTKLKYILETHLHADFVSGHVDLAKATGATIVYGPTAETGFKIQ
jgi:glyoxylase-like metal-dependent hydrolase (beta-lactamase superfamily II)